MLVHNDGLGVGAFVGFCVTGICVGLNVGSSDGLRDGLRVGVFVGLCVTGDLVGMRVTNRDHNVF